MASPLLTFGTRVKDIASILLLNRPSLIKTSLNHPENNKIKPNCFAHVAINETKPIQEKTETK